MKKKVAFAVTAASGAAAALAHHDAQASTQHTVKSGESLWSIANKYNTTPDELKQNNNLSNNMVFPGQVIKIGGGSGAQGESASSNSASPSSNASTHTVQAGESLNVIANKYGVSVDKLMKANNLNGYLITPNQTLKIPSNSNDGAASQQSGGSGGTTGVADQNDSPTFNHQNLYDWGQCTWHAFNRRKETGKPISTYWYNAENWASNAQADGYRVDNSPSVGSILQTVEGPVGHVAYVEQINPDGSILVSEMNYNTPPGTVGYRTIPASQVSNFNYIH
ncbi:LysM peptidoglycan-binding domain-containing protein [Staphylococcus sp. SQ8-PEA]|uniref:LysM peptidoglycan-binding domain-containing protein n=1 Tax=Staphylococcus marylandisciuri TaxID=2981529 RepID=A0ABT2QP56_9STAP|nr:LysM peptidoglycan-binding domain-containing protein [Staphylococcus marylandisciuri]MCU5745762.1 LysM peptidoglycan-binding domain-containing protein [Staphylococcus marylandisciuri]